MWGEAWVCYREFRPVTRHYLAQEATAMDTGKWRCNGEPTLARLLRFRRVR